MRTSPFLDTSINRRLAGISCCVAFAALAPFHSSAGQATAGPKPAGQPKQRAASVVNERNIQTAPTRFPLKIPQTGPLAVQLQVLLDRAGFSPGIIDGAWGLNAAKAITFFATPDDKARLTGGSPPTVTSIDKQTYERLRSAAGSNALVRSYTVTSEDLEGPFKPVPENVYS